MASRTRSPLVDSASCRTGAPDGLAIALRSPVRLATLRGGCAINRRRNPEPRPRRSLLAPPTEIERAGLEYIPGMTGVLLQPPGRAVKGRRAEARDSRGARPAGAPCRARNGPAPQKMSQRRPGDGACARAFISCGVGHDVPLLLGGWAFHEGFEVGCAERGQAAQVPPQGVAELLAPALRVLFPAALDCGDVCRRDACEADAFGGRDELATNDVPRVAPLPAPGNEGVCDVLCRRGPP